MFKYIAIHTRLPLPAVIFLCCLLLLLVILAILYFVVLKNENLCSGLTGHGTGEEGEEGEALLATETENPDGPVDGGGDGAGGSLATDVEKGLPTGSKKGSPVASTSARGSPRVAASLVEEKPQPGPSKAPIALPPSPVKPKSPQEPKPATNTTTESGGGDVGFISTNEEAPCLAGKVLMSFTYLPAANKLNLKVIRLAELPSIKRGGADSVRIHLCVLPMRKQRFKTKIQTASQGVFNQTFQFVHMTKDLLETCAIRLRVYGKKGFNTTKLIGEAKINLAKVDLTSPLADGDIWKNLSPKGEVAKYYNIDEEDEPDDIDDWAE
ncbi:synaptotagmin-3-like isoform X2 [Clytia hemisphaerica]|uniref:C2 domain-containing protein n=1 Tax=Clytia hemisphaerica TaxID=252671 RepID=A0A7M5X2C7_9CNID|eukprot:TCONS_00006413-protein